MESPLTEWISRDDVIKTRQTLEVLAEHFKDNNISLKNGHKYDVALLEDTTELIESVTRNFDHL